MRGAAADLARAVPIEGTSRVYAAAAVGGPVQPEFLNAAALVQLGPEGIEAAAIDLLDCLLGIERRYGRVRRERWGPRLIDLDILWIAETVIDLPRLMVPHPRLRDRAFAVVPLLELAPDARDPRTGERYVVPPGDIRMTGEVL